MAWSPEARRAALIARRRKAKGRKPTKLQKAKARKKKIIAKSSKKLSKKSIRRRGLTEYVDERGRRTGLATNTPSRTGRAAFGKLRRGSKYNKKVGKKLKRADKRIARARRGKR